MPVGKFKEKNMKKMFFASLKSIKKDSDPELDTDPDPHQNVTDPWPEPWRWHWYSMYFCSDVLSAFSQENKATVAGDKNVTYRYCMSHWTIEKK